MPNPTDPRSDDFAALLDEWRAGNQEAAEELVSRTYRELRCIAKGLLRRERAGHTLQPTALLHEAYLRLLRHGPGTLESRDAFFRLMSAEMRRRLVDHARRRLADKRGGRNIHDPLTTASLPIEATSPDELHGALERLELALAELGEAFPRAARVIELRFLAGLTTEETAVALGFSTGTVKREWTFARAWLASALGPDSNT